MKPLDKTLTPHELEVIALELEDWLAAEKEIEERLISEGRMF